MSLEEKFHKEMLKIYQLAGREVGYWAKYFIRAVKHHGGLEYAHRMLKVRKKDSMQKGLQALIDAGRIDLSVEFLVLKPDFNSLFSEEEIREAKRRLEEIPSFVKRTKVPPEEIFPETIPPKIPYAEGAAKKILVSSYERNPKARAACLAQYGYNCAVCDFNFQASYGPIGDKFIHVHHKKPLAAIRSEYKLDPINDLVPVCPNCHTTCSGCSSEFSIIIHLVRLESRPPESIAVIEASCERAVPGT